MDRGRLRRVYFVSSLAWRRVGFCEFAPAAQRTLWAMHGPPDHRPLLARLMRDKKYMNEHY